ncbi:DUF6292 family protein [Streptomyces sp. NPDC002402]
MRVEHGAACRRGLLLVVQGMSDLTQPHRPYVDAVVTALGDLAGTQVTVGHDGVEMEALIALADEEYDDEEVRTVRTMLHWTQTRGWEYAYDASNADDSDREPLLSALVPNPASVAEASRHASQVLSDLLPLRAPETPGHEGPLPTGLDLAVEFGDLPASLAAQLAAYMPPSLPE